MVGLDEGVDRSQAARGPVLSSGLVSGGLIRLGGELLLLVDWSSVVSWGRSVSWGGVSHHGGEESGGYEELEVRDLTGGNLDS